MQSVSQQHPKAGLPCGDGEEEEDLNLSLCTQETGSQPQSTPKHQELLDELRAISEP